MLSLTSHWWYHWPQPALRRELWWHWAGNCATRHLTTPLRRKQKIYYSFLPGLWSHPDRGLTSTMKRLAFWTGSEVAKLKEISKNSKRQNPDAKAEKQKKTLRSTEIRENRNTNTTHIHMQNTTYDGHKAQLVQPFLQGQCSTALPPKVKLWLRLRLARANIIIKTLFWTAVSSSYVWVTIETRTCTKPQHSSDSSGPPGRVRDLPWPQSDTTMAAHRANTGRVLVRRTARRPRFTAQLDSTYQYHTMGTRAGAEPRARVGRGHGTFISDGGKIKYLQPRVRNK